MAGGTVEGTARWRLSPGAARLRTHPLVLASLVVLVVNDHLLKTRWPGPVTGIASDVAGLVLLPVALVLLLDAVRREPLADRAVALISAVVAVGFAAVELLPAADAAYETGLGVAGWPVRAAFGGGGLRVSATSDPWDLLALPCSLAAAWLWRRHPVPAAAARPARGRRPELAPLVVVALAPALMATSPEPDPVSTSATRSVAVSLDPAHPAATVLVTIDADLSSAPREPTLSISLPHEPGQPALLVTSPHADELISTGYIEATSNRGSAGTVLEACSGHCHREVPVTVELAESTSGSWSGSVAASAEIRGEADGGVSLAIAADLEASNRPTGRLLASADLKALSGGSGEGADALLLRTRHPSAATSGWDANGDFQSDQLRVLAGLPDNAGDHGRLVQGRFATTERYAIDRLSSEVASRLCEQAVPACEQLAVVFPPKEPLDDFAGRTTSDPFRVVVADSRPPGADPVEVDLVPATTDTVTVAPGADLASTGVPVAVPPGQTLYALIDFADRPDRWEDELTLDVLRSDGTEVRTDFAPGVTQIEACPTAAAAPCTANIRWSSKTPESVELLTLLAPNA